VKVKIVEIKLLRISSRAAPDFGVVPPKSALLSLSSKSFSPILETIQLFKDLERENKTYLLSVEGLLHYVSDREARAKFVGLKSPIC
jgi:hypothetical protein